MKIKTKKEMDLQQLIKWVIDNDIVNEFVKLNSDYPIKQGIAIDARGRLHIVGMDYLSKNNTFTVEVEETLTQDTVFPSLAVVRKQHFASGNSTIHVTKINNKSINSLIGKQPINSTFEYKEVYIMDDDKLGQCIWSDGKLVE